VTRPDVIRAALELLSDDVIVVSNIADASFELCQLNDRPRNFYMLGSFGLAPSIGLGLALSRPERVVVIDGDGALLYNLGSLPTEGRYAPPNYLHLVIDNGAHGATGYQPTATSTGADLTAVATACGLPARRIPTLAALREALGAWLASPGASLLLVPVTERPAQQAPLPPYSGREIMERFGKALGVDRPW
jgi:thiamine pyrophosphate-dependent acetolactate synthase large subunit-like protein